MIHQVEKTKKPELPIQLVDLVNLHRRLWNEMEPEIKKVMESASFINGPQVGELECELSGYLGCKYSIGCANGTDALVVALRALNIGPGDEVITTPFTFAATVEAILLVGATARYADIDADTFNINPNLIQDAISLKTKAIMPVHLYGQPANMEEIMALASKHGLYVIEDNAQSFGAHWNGKKAGTFGHISTTSFFPAKNLGAFGDAGGIFTNDEALYQRLKMIAQHGAKIRYTHELLGFNSRIDTLQAAVLKVKLRHLPSFNLARQKAAALYNQYLSGVKVKTPIVHPKADHIYHQYTIVLDSMEQRDGLQKFLHGAGVPSSVHYPISLNLQKAFLDEKYPKGSLPISESLGGRVLSLPMHTELEEEEIAYVADSIGEYCGLR
ncbi:MAG: DegT/DnrJ/EryC1/StrS family aminotransferase [Chloroherpetonaceae bacterium]|nr:DegT/DnrJ/EryC1/StrS family aminotransferase [Chloroherpetonaceae bacterium]